MAWTYCDNCGHGLDKATTREALRDEHYCPNCGARQELSQYDKIDALIDLLDRVERLELEL